MGSHFESTADACRSVDDGNRHGPLVTRCRPGTFQDQRGSRGLVTINDQGLKSLTGQSLNCAVGIRAMLQTNLEVAQNSSQNP